MKVGGRAGDAKSELIRLYLASHVVVDRKMILGLAFAQLTIEKGSRDQADDQYHCTRYILAHGSDHKQILSQGSGLEIIVHLITFV